MKLDSTLEYPSHSRLSRFHECRRAYMYRYVMGLRARGQGTKQVAGKAGHAALDIMHRLGYGTLAVAKNAIDLAYTDHVVSDHSPWLTNEHMHGIIANYADRYAEDDADFKRISLNANDLENNDDVLFADIVDRVGEDGQLSMNEMPMVIKLSDQLAMTLVLDMLVERKDGTIWVADHKFTAAYLGQGVLNRYLVSHQMPLYILAARKLVGRCDGAILNAVFMGQAAINPASKAGKFDRYYFDYTAGQLAESLDWATRSKRMAKTETLAFNRDEPFWLQSPSNNCSGCDYLQLCEVAPAMRAGRIAQWYDHTEEVTT